MHSPHCPITGERLPHGRQSCKQQYVIVEISAKDNDSQLRRKRLVPALTVATLCLVGTAIAAYMAMMEVTTREKDLFNRLLDGVYSNSVQSLESYERLLSGIAGFVAGSDDVTEKKWVDYIDAVQRDDLLPAVRDFGLVDVTNDKVETAAVRFLTFVDGRTIRPDGRGFFTEQPLKNAARRAYESGDLSLSGMVKRPFDVVEGVAYALIASARTPENTDATRQNLVLLSFVTDEMMANAMRNITFPVCLELYDSADTDPDSLAHRACKNGADLSDQFHVEKRTIFIGGRTLTLCLTAPEGFYIAPLALPASVIIPLGIVIAALLGGLLWFEAQTRERARSLAETMNKDLEITRNRYDRVVRVAGVGFWERDHIAKQTLWSERMWALMGLKQKKIFGPPDTRRHCDGRPPGRQDPCGRGAQSTH